MKKFFYKTVIIFSLTVLPYFGFQFWFISKLDPNYAMLTHKSESIITGLSRGKRISPDILQEELKLNSVPQNLARSNHTTPYGLHYLTFLKKKVKASENESIHIVCVSPIAIMDLVGAPKIGREADKSFYHLKLVNNPFNIEYLISRSAIMALRTSFLEKKIHVKTIPHKNGWYEVVPLKGYKNVHVDLKRKFTFSETRIRYLKETIDFLKTTGTVYIVRTPIGTQMLEIEKGIFTNFNELIQTISKEHNVPYFDFSNTGHLYKFTDLPEHHLDSESSKRFTRKLASAIKDYGSNNQQ